MTWLISLQIAAATSSTEARRVSRAAMRWMPRVVGSSPICRCGPVNDGLVRETARVRRATARSCWVNSCRCAESARPCRHWLPPRRSKRSTVLFWSAHRTAEQAVEERAAVVLGFGGCGELQRAVTVIEIRRRRRRRRRPHTGRRGGRPAANVRGQAWLAARRRGDRRVFLRMGREGHRCGHASWR